MSFNGLISGTPVVAGAYSFSVTSTEVAGFSVSQAYSGTVGAGRPVLADSSATVAYGSAGNDIAVSNSGGVATSVSVTGAASHGTAVAAGPGLAYTPTAGFFGADSFTYTATNAVGTSDAATVTVTVSPPTIIVTTTTLSPGNLNVAYSQNLNASGGASPYTFALASGALPPGLTLSAGGNVSGTPTTAGTFNFTVSGTDSSTSTPATFTSSTISLSISAVPNAPTSVQATAGDTQASVSFTAPASNGGAAVTGYTVTASPGGAVASGASSPITVTGLTNGVSYTFTVTATNPIGTGPASTVSNSVTPASSQTITFSNPGAQNFGTTPTLTATADSGLTPTFSSSTAGVCTISSGGVLNFATAGTCTINADQAGDGSYLPAARVSQSFTVIGLLPGAPVINSVTGGNARASVAFTAPVSDGGTAITHYTVTSTPGGIVETGTTSPIMVTGLTNGTAYTFTVVASNGTGAGAASAVSASVTPTPVTLSFSPASGVLDPAMAGEGYTQAISATGGSGTVTYSHTGGTVPDGVILNQTTGELTARPISAAAPLGQYSFTITATDANGATGSATYTLEVAQLEVTAADKEIVVPPGSTPLPVDLTKGATGGPFTSAVVGTVTPPQAGTAEVTMGDVAAVGTFYPTTFYLKFHPNPEFSGTAVVGYTLISAFGTSNSATVSFKTALDVVAAAKRFDSLVHGFVETRQSLLASGVKVPGLLQRRGMAGGNSPGTIDIAPNGNAVTMNFASSLAQMKAWNQAGDAANALAASDAQSPFNVWIDGTATLHLKTDNGEDHWGKFGLVAVGADYLVNDKLLIGLALHADVMDDLTSTSTTKGTGLLVGPYVSAEIGDGVFLDASVFYGHSWNEVSTSIFGGTFETDRLLANAKLEGEWALGDSLTFRPNVTAFYLHEKVGDYSVSNSVGEAVMLSGFATDQLRLSAGGVLEYAMPYGDNLMLKPYVGANVGLASINGSGFGGGAFGLLSGGFSLTGDGDWSVRTGLEMGLDASGLKTGSAKAGLRVNF